ncbi:MAG: hypothetical protein ACMUHY_07505 [Thermoplasmatota archaeon]
MTGVAGGFQDMVDRLRPGRWLEGRRRSDLLCILLLFLTICVFFWKVVLNPDHIIYSPDSDTIEQYYPWRYVAGSSADNGDLPFWNPYNYAGEPLLANMQLGFFYLPNILLFWLLPAHSVFGISVIIHLLIAGSSTYLLARRIGLGRNASFVSGTVLIFSGYFIGHIYSGHYGQVCSASWIPLIFLVFDLTLKKRSIWWGALTGLLVGNQFLAGHIQIVLFSAIMLVISYIHHLYFRRGMIRGITDFARTLPGPLLGGIVALAAASIQIIPTYLYTDQTTRSGGMSYLWATDYSLPPWNVLTLLVPRIFGTPLDGNYWHLWNYWELSIYIGIPTIVLILFSFRYRYNRYFRTFLGLGLFSFVMALGRFTPLYWIFWKFVPGFDILRVPSRFVLLCIFSASIMAGFGFMSLERRMDRIRIGRIKRLSSWIMGISAGILVLVLLLLIFRGLVSDLSENVIRDVIGDEGEVSEKVSMIPSAFDTAVIDILTFILILAGTTGILIWRSSRRDRPRYFGLVLTSYLILNLALYQIPFIDSMDPDEVYDIEPYVEFLRSNAEGYRVYDPGDVMRDNFQIIYGIETVKGYNPLELRYYSELVDSIRNLSGNGYHPILDILNVRYIITSDRLTGSGFDLAFIQSEDRTVFIYENPGVLGRAFLVANITAEDDEGSLRIIREEDFDPLSSVPVSGEPEAFGESVPSSVEGSRVAITSRTNNRIDLSASLDGRGFLVVSMAHYSSWDVIVDGERHPAERAFHGLAGVYLESGVHDIAFVYDRYP